MRPARFLRLLVLLGALAASIVLLLSDDERVVVMEGFFREFEPPDPAERCPTVHPHRTRWTVEAPDGFDILELAFREALGVRCAANCLAEHRVVLRPRWVEKPGFFSGYAVLDVPIRIEREVGACRDVTTMRLDVRIDQGRRGRPWIAATTAGRVAGTRSLLTFAEWLVAADGAAADRVEADQAQHGEAEPRQP